MQYKGKSSLSCGLWW